MSEKTKSVDGWVTLKQVRVRKGKKGAWFEMIVTRPDGTEAKLIAKKVDRFYSENDAETEI